MSPLSDVSAELEVNSENRAAVAAATARFVNQAVGARIQQVAEAEAERAALERRVWRWALLGMLCLVVLGAVFALVSRWHWL